MTRRSTVMRSLELLEELPVDAHEMRRRVVESMRLLDMADTAGVVGLADSSEPGVIDITWQVFTGEERARQLIDRVTAPQTRHLAWRHSDLHHSPRRQRRRFHSIGDLFERRTAFIEGESWQRLYAASGVSDQTRLLVAHAGFIVAFVFLLRFQGAPNFSGEPRLQRLVPRMRGALIAAHGLAAQPGEPADFVVDPAGRVLFASSAGKQWTAMPGFSEWLTQRVRAVDGGVEDKASSGRSCVDASTSITRVFGSEGVRYLVHVARQPLLRLSALASLSPAQQEVAELAGAGATLTEIARMTNRSHETVRSHLSVVYERLQVSSRAELGRVVALA